MNRTRVIVIVLVLAITVIVIALIGGEKGFIIDANNNYYMENTTPERIYTGTLRETGDKILNYPLHRNFYLELDNGNVMYINRRDTKDMILGSLLKRRVEIRGKYVQLDKEAGGRKELQVGYITPK